MVAKTLRPMCPNHVTAATTQHRKTAIKVRRGASDGKNAIAADAAAATLIAIVRTKSTINAPSGRNAQPSPKAAPVAATAPPPSGNRRISWS